MAQNNITMNPQRKFVKKQFLIEIYDNTKWTMAQNNITMNPIEGSIKDYLKQKSTNPCNRTSSIPNPSTHSNIEHRFSHLQIKSNATISHKKLWPIVLDLQTPQNINIHKPYPNPPNKLNHTQYIYKKLKIYITFEG